MTFPSTVSNYWGEEESSTWSLLNFDMYIVDKIPDINKDKAHSLFIIETEKLLEIHSKSHELVARIKSLQKEFKKRHKNKAINEFWTNYKNKAVAQAIESRLIESNLQDAVKETLATTLTIGAAAQSNENRTSTTATGGELTTSSTSNDNQVEKRAVDDVGSSKKAAKRRKTNFFKSGGQRSSKLERDNLRWYIDGVDVSGVLMEMRDKIMNRLANNKTCTIQEQLIANFIFFFTERFEDSTSKILGRITHNQLIADLDIPVPVALPSYTAMWLDETLQALKIAKGSFEVKKVCFNLLNRAIQEENEEILNLADVIYRLAPRFLAWEQQRVVEGTFINSHLADLLDVIFGDHELLTYEWTNKKMANVGFTLSINENEREKENHTPAQQQQQQQQKNKKDGGPMIPDYVSSVLGKNGDLLNVFVVEVKAPYRNQGSNDYFKVGEEMKQMISVLSNLGVENARVCGLLVDGWKCTAYTMFLKNEGIYPYVKIGEFSLVPSKERVCDLKHAVEVLQMIKSIILKTANLIEQSDLELLRSVLIRPSYQRGFD